MITMKEIESVITKRCSNCANFLACWLDGKLIEHTYDSKCKNWIPDWETVEREYKPELRKRGFDL